jgi:hypothetical protein
VLTIRHTAWRRHHPTDPNPEDKGMSRRPQSERSGKECLIGGGGLVRLPFVHSRHRARYRRSQRRGAQAGGTDAGVPDRLKSNVG